MASFGDMPDQFLYSKDSKETSASAPEPQNRPIAILLCVKDTFLSTPKPQNRPIAI